MVCIFTNFWTWLGAVILIGFIFDGMVKVIEAARPHRKLRISQSGKSYVVEIENATEGDVDVALADVSLNGEEIYAND